MHGDFDGGLPGGRSSMSTRGVQVIFAAAQHSNADSLIKRRIRKMRDARNWTVVSSDNEILACARRCQMKTLTSPEFARELSAVRRPQAAQSPSEKENPALSAHEVQQWLDLFAADEN